MDITNQGIQCVPRNCVVLLGTNLGSETGGQNSSAESFSQNSDTENHVGDLESITDNIKVSSGEDEEHNGGISDSGSSWILPREQTAKEAMIVGKGLPGSSRCSWGLS